MILLMQKKILKFTKKNRKYFRSFDAYVNLTGYLKPNLIKDLNVKTFPIILTQIS